MSSALTKFADKLLGRSAYQKPQAGAGGVLTSLDNADVIRAREGMGGQLAPPPVSRTRWYLADIESAAYAADTGNLAAAAQLMRAAHSDGKYMGVLSTRTLGLVRLPKVFVGDAKLASELQPGRTSGTTNDNARSIFDEMCPASELAQLASDGEELGVGVAELVPVAGREFPVMVRLNPEFLYYQWWTNQWYYRSIVGQIEITPGDGRWVLHCPGGRTSPWQNGFWRAVAYAYVRKTLASFAKDLWESKLANSARVAVAPAGSTDEQAAGWFERVAAWGYNTVFQVRPGYDVKLLESNGIGWKSFESTIKEQNETYVITVAGQTVTTDGGAGFSNMDVHKSIRADLIQSTADALAYTINTQVLPQYVLTKYGEEALESRTILVYWDVTPPKDLNSEATSLVTAANAIKGLTEALNPYELTLDAEQVCVDYGIPLNRKKQDADDTADNKAAMNGTQISSLLEVVTSCAAGLIPRDAAVAMLEAAFLKTPEEAERLVGSAGTDAFALPVANDNVKETTDGETPNADADADADK